MSTSPDLVVLDADHPGFRDPQYRARRNEIARIGLSHERGQPVPDVRYVDEEHQTWRTALAELASLHERLACKRYCDAAVRFALDVERIPQLREVNAILEPLTRFQLLPVAGLVSPSGFLERLGDGEFLATQYVRHRSRPLYTPEPDVIHELVGHAVSLVDPAFSSLNRLFGRAAQRGGDPLPLIRAYWFTLEFGVVMEDGAPKAYGAGLLSSFGELGRFRDAADLRPFDLEVIAGTDFDPTRYQDTLFVAPSFDEMVRSLTAWLGG